jgi:anti-sigma factor RsiW
MIDPTSPVTEDELHAYIDGELAADRRGAIESWLAAHPEDMARVAAWRAQMESIRARYGAVADEPVPARFDLDRLISADRPWTRIAAAVAVAAFIGGGGVGWLAHGAITGAPGVPPDSFEAFTTDAVEAYKLYVVEVRHPVEVTAADADHLVQWLSKRVGYQLRAPNLEPIGLKLVGGRLLPGPTGAAAFFMYESASGERYTLYCGRSHAPATALRYSEGGQASTIYWVNSEVAYVISGHGDRKQLQNVAVAAYEQLDERAAHKPNGG